MVTPEGMWEKLKITIQAAAKETLNRQKIWILDKVLDLREKKKKCDKLHTVQTKEKSMT